MQTTAQRNATDLSDIHEAGITYTVRKYAGAWVPVIIAGGKRLSFAHCSTSAGAIEMAISHAAKISRTYNA